jgi:hypothetical protein
VGGPPPSSSSSFFGKIFSLIHYPAVIIPAVVCLLRPLGVPFFCFVFTQLRKALANC